MTSSQQAFSLCAEAPYVSLRTFRKSGVAVDTPVWSAPAGKKLYVFSAGAAGKVKRIRNNAGCEICVCDVRGKVLGPWFPCSTLEIKTPEEVSIALNALRRKYGWQMKIADWGAKLTGKFNKRAYLGITIE
ncbi:MAG: PPOX class F420-dependent oxidoreductase [bacterium]